MTVFRSVPLFLAAAVCEIGGGPRLVWQGVGGHRGWDQDESTTNKSPAQCRDRACAPGGSESFLPQGGDFGNV